MKYLAVDIGGTFIKVGLVSGQGQVLKKERYAADFDGYRTPLQETALRSAEVFVSDLAQAEGLEGKHRRQWLQEMDIQGIGISATCLIDEKGRVAGAHIPGYEGAELKRSFEEHFSLETRVVNDANSAALAELWTGAMRGCQNAILLTIGTGIGGGIIVNGRLLSGTHGFGGEVGHISIKKDGPLAAYGNRGGFEEYASTKALLQRVEERLMEEALPLPEEGLSGHWVFERAAAGDALAQQAIEAWIDDIAVGIENLVYIFDPELVVIGGGVSSQEKWLIRPLEKRLQKGLMHAYRKDIRLVAASHGNDAGLIGAVYSFAGERGAKAERG